MAKQFPVNNAVFSIAFSELQSNVIAFGTGDGFFRLHDFSTTQDAPLVNLRLSTKEINSICCNHFIPSLFLVSGKEAKLWLVDSATQKIDVISQGEHFDSVSKVLWHPRQKNLLSSASNDGRVIFYDLLSRGKKSLFDIRDSRNVLSIDYNKYNELFVTGSVDSSIKLYDLRNPVKPLFVFRGHRYGVSRVKFSPLDQNLLASGS